LSVAVSTLFHFRIHPKQRGDMRPPLDLLRPFERDAMVKWACNQLVGNVRNNDPGDADAFLKVKSRRSMEAQRQKLLRRSGKGIRGSEKLVRLLES
jgi:hypothetical protein